MKNHQINSDQKRCPFKGRPYLKLKRVHAEPRQRIRQLLRSFISLNEIRNRKGNTPQ